MYSSEEQRCANVTLVDCNGEGFILVLTLVMLVVISIIGGAAMIIRNTEEQIATNTEIFTSNFYAVEAVTLEGAAMLANLPDKTLLDTSAYPDWLKSDKNIPANLQEINQWPSRLISPEQTHLKSGPSNIIPPGFLTNAADSAANDRIQYAAVDRGLCPGSSVSHGGRFEKCFSIFGLYDVKEGPGKAYPGRHMLNVGYKKVVYTE